jgi:hypothetical protein
MQLVQEVRCLTCACGRLICSSFTAVSSSTCSSAIDSGEEKDPRESHGRYNFVPALSWALSAYTEVLQRVEFGTWRRFKDSELYPQVAHIGACTVHARVLTELSQFKALYNREAVTHETSTGRNQ